MVWLIVPFDPSVKVTKIAPSDPAEGDKNGLPIGSNKGQSKQGTENAPGSPGTVFTNTNPTVLEGGYLFDQEKSQHYLEKLMKSADVWKQMIEESLTVDQAIEKAKSKTGDYGPLRFAQLWKDLHVVHKIEGFHAGLTKAETGQLWGAAKKMEGVDAVDAGRVMSACIGWWVYFWKFCKEHGVVWEVGTKPHIGFFVKNAALAVDFYHTGDFHKTVKKATGPKKYVAGSV